LGTVVQDAIAFCLACVTGAVMKHKSADYSLYEIPELEDSEFALRVSPCPRIEDPNENGEIGDSFSIGLDTMDEYFGAAS